MSTLGKTWKVKNRKKPARPIVVKLASSQPPEGTFLSGGMAPGWPLAGTTPPASPTGSMLKDALAYVDPTRLITAQMFVPYNPSILVTRRGLSIFDQMGLDEQVKAALSFKILAVIASGWEVASPGDQEEDWEVTTFVRDCLTHFPGGWNDALKKFLRALRFGYSVTEKVYAERDSGPLKGKLVLDRLVELKPHYIDFETDASGKVGAIIQMPSAAQKGEGRYSPLKFVHYVYDREFENPYGKSDLEAAYRAWWTKDNAYKWFAILLERYGIPPLFALYDANQYQGPDLEQLKKVVKNIQAATMGIIPRGSKEGLEFWSQSLAAGSQDLFSSALARFDADIAKALLQPSLTGFAQESGSQGAQSGGSLARANVSWKSFMMVVREIQEDIAANAVNSQVIPQLCDLNYSGLKSYPVYKAGRLDEEKEVELFRLWSELVSGKVVNRIEDDETHIRKSLGMPENDEPVLEPLPAAGVDDKPDKGLVPEDEKPKKVPVDELSEEMRAFAEESGGEWVMLGNHPVCFATGDLEGDGVWRTINGRRVFIREGESVESALQRSLDREKADPWHGKPPDIPGGFKIPPPPGEKPYDPKEGLGKGKKPHGMVSDLMKRFPNREALTSYLNGLPNEQLRKGLQAIKNDSHEDSKYVREVIREVLKP